jgi:uncharacterized protein (DUF1697 family)
MEKYVALLRGINIGGHKKVPMKELKKALEQQSFLNVKTLLNSGNVVFEGEKDAVLSIQGLLEKTFGFSIDTIVLPFEEVVKLVGSEPFKEVKVTPQIRMYVTFLPKKSESKLAIPYLSEDGSFRIIKLTDVAVFSVLDLDKSKSTDAMKILEKEYGKHITSRNYNTVLKIATL